MISKPIRRMQKARAALLMSAPFFGALAMRLNMVADEQTDTMSVDGVTLKFNPERVVAMPFDELKAVVAHEVLHCAAGHPFRRGARDDQKWNVACDYAINPIVRDAGFTLPADALLDPAYDGKSAEAIYAMLPDSTDGQGEGKGNGCGSVDDAPEDAAQPAEQRQSEQDWKIAAMQAEAIAKRAGHGSQSAERLLDEIKHPPAPWRDILRQFITERARDDYTWRRPNRRFLGQGIYLPSLYSERLGEIVVAIDTSGSTSYIQESFFAELSSIFEDCEPTKLHLVYCDSAIQITDEIEPGAEIPKRTVVGGGTDFRPAFEWVEAHDIAPSAMIYLTDLYGPAPDEAPAYPVLWASVGAQQAPFGSVVKIEP